MSRIRNSSHQDHKPHQHQHQHQDKQQLALFNPIGNPPWVQPEQYSMAQLTLALFALDPHQLHSKTSAELSYVLLPQMATTRPYVNAAAGVLGAVYDKCILHRGSDRNDQLIPRLYLKALRQIQEELRRPDPELAPLLMAAILLAATEIIQNRRRDALCHLLGAFGMLKLESATSPKPKYDTIVGPVAPKRAFEGLGPVQDFLYSLDYHISMFAWGRTPRFPHLPVTNPTLYPTSLDDLTTGHPALQQWSLHFIAEAMAPQYAERIDFPPTLVMQQGYMVAWLKRWLRTYALVFETPSSRKPPLQTPKFRILKAQALAMFIAVSNVKPPTQVTYDAFAPQFEEIIRCAEYTLYPDCPTDTSAPIRSLPPYSPVPGIIYPLSFTARRYRDPVSRRRAIHLLRHAGMEGPFRGEFEARIAARLVELEESRKPFEAVLCATEVLGPSDIKDSDRICLCWVEEWLEQGGAMPDIPVGEKTRRWMHFSRRRRLAPLTGDTEKETQPLNSNSDQDGNEMWEVWAEAVQETWPLEESNY